MSSRGDCRIYVGNLPPDIRTKDIEEFFRKFGKISFVDLKNRKGPPFAFIEFEDARDADDAVKNRDGYDYDGYRLRVEFPRGGGPRGPGGRRMWEGGGGGGGGGARGGRGGGPSRRTNYRVVVSGLPPTGSWQDLKDHMREAGDVCYADVFRDGSGVVEYLRHDDMKYALRKLDDTKFRSHEGETAYVRVKEETERGRGGDHRNGRARSRSPPSPRPRARGSPTYSPARKSRSRSRSASKSKSRSPSKSRSRSPRSRSRSRSRS